MVDELIERLATCPALSIRQPWPWCILHAGKDIENRDWNAKFRGPVLIHASKGMTRDEYEDCLDTAHMIGRRYPFPSGLTMPAFEDMERGGIVGVMEIIGCVADSPSPWFFGKYGLVIRNAQPLPFTPCNGALGLFRPEIDRAPLIAALKARASKEPK